jgi:hypothetical protein
MSDESRPMTPQEEIDNLKKARDGYARALAQVRIECEKQKVKVKAVEAVLKRYGYHRLDCERFVPGSSGACDCGWAEARTTLSGDEL